MESKLAGSGAPDTGCFEFEVVGAIADKVAVRPACRMFAVRVGRRALAVAGQWTILTAMPSGPLANEFFPGGAAAALVPLKAGAHMLNELRREWRGGSVPPIGTGLGAIDERFPI